MSAPWPNGDLMRLIALTTEEAATGGCDRRSEPVVPGDHRHRCSRKNSPGAEVDALKVVRKAIREALTWDYETVKAHRNWRNIRIDLPAEASPQCPIRQAPQFANALRLLEVDARKTFRLSIGGDIGRLVTWQPEPAKPTVCD